MTLLVEKIISGGQTGADIGGLIVGRKLGVETGGTAPRGFRTENGSNKNLGTIYGLKESTSDKYPPRTMKNVDDSDGTIAFLFRSSAGTKKTIGYCHTRQWISRGTSKNDGYRPVLVITRITDDTIKQIRNFIIENDIKTLNIAGHRESSYRGIQDQVVSVLQEALQIEE